ncbi:MAG: hypothetical protein KBG62_09395 [Propionivibrio sp.]|jgi:hypothetical protein|nr:hypothetical protein [Propionivibrio sp.]
MSNPWACALPTMAAVIHLFELTCKGDNMPNFDQTGRGGNRLFHGAFNGMGRGRRCRGSGRNAFHMSSPQYSCDMQQRGHSRSGMSSGMNFSARNTQGSGWLGARIEKLESRIAALQQHINELKGKLIRETTVSPD